MSDDLRFSDTPLWLALLGVVPVAVAAALLVWARRRGRTAPAFVATTFAAMMALELPWNTMYFTMGPQFWLVELALVAGLLATLWLVSGRRAVAPAIGIAALYAIGVAQHYVLEFRGTSILPSDIFALSTALSVSGGYVYTVSPGMVLGLVAAGIGCAGCRLLSSAAREARAAAGRPAHAGARAYARDLALAYGTAALTAALVVLPSYGSLFGANIDYWWSRDWYQRQGFLPSFIYAVQDLKLAPPEGYTAEGAEALEAELADAYLSDPAVAERREASTAQFAAAKPNVVVIQNETFCDLSNFDGLRNGYTGPAFWNSSPQGALAHGAFGVTVFGGGTCNTEFEFLTGNALGTSGTSKYPFTMYDLSVFASLPRQLAAQGYATVGIHPNIASNWNRDRAYAQLGFDRFLSIDDFADAEQFHTHVSDWATYQKVLNLIDATDEPLFAFDVTMQNHSGYDTGSIPSDLLRGYTLDGLSDDDTFQLNEFLACIDESDRALARLVEELEARDEPTVVVMYGDHHPWFSEALNDLLFAHEGADEHARRIHETSYLVWANYDVAGWTAGNLARDTRSDELAAQTLDAIGAPLSTYQAAQLGAGDGQDFSLVAYLNFGARV